MEDLFVIWTQAAVSIRLLHRHLFLFTSPYFLLIFFDWHCLCNKRNFCVFTMEKIFIMIFNPK